MGYLHPLPYPDREGSTAPQVGEMSDRGMEMHPANLNIDHGEVRKISDVLDGNPFSEFADEGPPSAGVGASALDVGAQGLSRLGEGVLDIPGIPRELSDTGTDLYNTGSQAVEDLFGSARTIPPSERARSPLGALPNSEEVKRAVGFERRRPTTAAGEVFDKGLAGDIVEGAPSVLLSGPKKILEEGLARGTGRALLKYDVAPRTTGAAARKGAEKLGLPEGWQQAAEMVGNFAALGVAGLHEKPNFAAPEVADWETAGKTMFDAARRQGVVFDRTAFNQMVNHTISKLRGEGYPGTPGAIRDQAAKTKVLVDDLLAMSRQQGPVSFNDLDSIHRLASKAAASAGDLDGHLAFSVVDGLHNFIGSARSMSAGDPKLAQKYATWGQRYFSQMYKARAIEQAMDSAKLSKAWDNMNRDQALRDAFRPLLKNKGLMSEFTSNERQAVWEVVSGGRTERALKKLGSFSFVTAPFRAFAAGYTGARAAEMVGLPAEVGVAATVGLPLAGRKIVTGMTQRAAEASRTMVLRDDDAKIPLLPGLRPALRMAPVYGAGPSQNDRVKVLNPFQEFAK